MSEFEKFEIELPKQFAVQRAGGTCIIETAKFVQHANIVALLLERELANKIGDAPSGVKSALGAPYHDGNSVTLKDDDMTPEQKRVMAEKAESMMNAVRDNNLYAGKWVVRVGGGSVDEHKDYRQALDLVLTKAMRHADKKAKCNKDTREAFLTGVKDEEAASYIKTAKALQKQLDAIDVDI